MTKTQAVSLRLDTTTYKILNDIARQEDTPLSYVIRKILRDHLKKTGHLGTSTAKPAHNDTAEDWD